MKTCTRCRAEKEESEFYKSKRFGLTHWCKTCFREAHREQRELEPDRLSQINREKAKRWYYAHHEEAKAKLRIKQATPEAREYLNRWKRTPTGRVHVARYNARRREFTKNDRKLSRADVENLLDIQNNLCMGCHRPFTKELPYTLDHIVPVSKGGVLRVDNVQLLCQPCNSRKGNRVTAGG